MERKNLREVRDARDRCMKEVDQLSGREGNVGDLVVETGLFLEVGNESALGTFPGAMSETDAGEITRDLVGLELGGHGMVVVIKEFGPDGTRILITEMVRHDGLGLGCLHLVLEDLEEPVLLSGVELWVGDDELRVDKMRKSVGFDGRGESFFGANPVRFVLEFLVVGTAGADGTIPLVKIFTFGSRNGNHPWDDIRAGIVDLGTKSIESGLLGHVDVNGSTVASTNVMVEGEECLEQSPVGDAEGLLGCSVGRIGGDDEVVNVEDRESEKLAVEAFHASVLECDDNVIVIVSGLTDAEMGHQRKFQSIGIGLDLGDRRCHCRK